MESAEYGDCVDGPLSREAVEIAVRVPRLGAARFIVKRNDSVTRRRSDFSLRMRTSSSNSLRSVRRSVQRRH